MARLTAHAPILAAAIVGAMVWEAPGHTARVNYDGAWSVLGITEAGTCDRAYRYGVRISNGRVVYDGGAESGPVQISGTVDPNGRVAVSLRSGDRVANGSGRLSGDSGSGQWTGQSSTQQCSGRWEAERRG